MRILNAKISIGMTHGGINEDAPIRIAIQDKASRMRILSLQMTKEDFTEAALGSREVDCVVEMSDSPVIGMHLQHKEERIPLSKVPSAYGNRHKAAAEAVRPFEVDGWRGCEDDYCNPHRHVSGTARVEFTRWISQETGLPYIWREE